MKKLYTLLILSLISVSTIGQAPQSFSYQAIVRDNSGNQIADQTVGIQISLQQSVPVSGPIVYVERFTPVTNGFGLIKIDIGAGDVQSGVFEDIDWSAGPYFIKIELDQNGGTDYTDMGTNQLLSVPYALYAETVRTDPLAEDWVRSGLDVYYNDGNVGVGTDSPTSLLQVEGSLDNPEVPIFEVKNDAGIPVFAVYNNGIRILIQDELNKGPKGGFAIGGFDRTKGSPTFDYMWVSPDSTKFILDNTPTKGLKGGFAIGSFDRESKGGTNTFMNLTPEVSYTGKYNTILGYNAGISNFGERNTFIGHEAGKENIDGTNNVYIGTGSGTFGTTGFENVFIGSGSGANLSEGSRNIVIGYEAGLNLEEGSNNVIIGNKAGSGTTSFRDRLIIEGAWGVSEPLIDGDFSAQFLRINGDLEYTGELAHVSDQRLKTNFEGVENVLEKLQLISGYYFNWNDEAMNAMGLDNKRQIGFIAQELESEFPELVSENEYGYKMVNYPGIAPVLLEAIKEQQNEIDKLNRELLQLRELVNTIVSTEEK